MSVTTNVHLPPNIVQKYNPLLLMNYFQRVKWRVDNVILPLSSKKIRPEDVGKRREFDKLMKEFEEVYGRKEAEEADYKEKIKEKGKRPCLPIAGATISFKRMVSRN